MIEVAESVRRTTGPPLITRDDPPRAGDPAEVIAEVTRIRTELGWIAKRVDLDEIVGSAFRAGAGI